MSNQQYSTNLDKNAANYSPLSPLTFIERAAAVYPERCALIYSDTRRTWAETYARCRRFAGALRQHGIAADDTVALMLPNVPAMYEAHFAIPMAGAVINGLNIRLDASAIAFQLEHSGAKILFTDPEFSATITSALDMLDEKPVVIDVADAAFDGGERIGVIEYEEFLASGDPGFAWKLPQDEWRAIALGYTSGTTGNPKGVVTHHRGAHLNAVSNILAWNMQAHPIYLWTLPMFHCNGWCFPWTIAALNGTSVCLRATRADAIFEAIKEHNVSHLCGAPIVLNLMANADDDLKQKLAGPVSVMTAGSAPPAAVLEAMAELNFEVTHTYGLTEVYGPAVVCSWHDEWNELPPGEHKDAGVAQLIHHRRIPIHHPLQRVTELADPGFDCAHFLSLGTVGKLTHDLFHRRGADGDYLDTVVLFVAQALAGELLHALPQTAT